MNRHAKKSSRLNLISTYTYATLGILLLSLLGVAVFFTASFSRKESHRSGVFRATIQAFLEHQYQPITEEAWTENYESISMRLERIALQLGAEAKNVYLRGPSGECRYARQDGAITDCKDTSIWQASGTSGSVVAPQLNFDLKTGLFLYRTRLEIGPVPLGELAVGFTDPNDFLREDSVVSYAILHLTPVAIVTLFIWGIWLAISRRIFLTPYTAYMGELQKKEAVARIASQVAHDLRSPLAVLGIVLDGLRDVSDRDRKIIQASLQRIRGITGDLRTMRHKDEETSSETFSAEVSSGSVLQIAPVIDEILWEKQIQYAGRFAVVVRSLAGSDPIRMAVAIKADELKRILSNLLDNAADASPDEAEILIELAEDGDQVVIAIVDQGHGIPVELLPKLGVEGATFGKAGGTGLGLFHARTSVEAIGGQLKIASEIGVGTQVSLHLPLAPLQAWMTTKIVLPHEAILVIVDDDLSIHHLWQDRLEAHCLGKLEIVSLDSAQRMKAWLASLADGELERCFFLFDHDLGAEGPNGLDLIQAHDLAAQSILVTTIATNPKIISRCISLQVGLLAKSLIRSVPIVTETPSLQPTAMSQVDAILIDDDVWIRESWQMYGARHDLRILTLAESPLMNLALLNALAMTTPFFVDVELGNEVSGVTVARQLVERGFTKVYLATGHDPGDFAQLDWLAGVLGKDPPAWLTPPAQASGPESTAERS